MSCAGKKEGDRITTYELCAQRLRLSITSKKDCFQRILRCTRETLRLPLICVRDINSNSENIPEKSRKTKQRQEDGTNNTEHGDRTQGNTPKLLLEWTCFLIITGSAVMGWIPRRGAAPRGHYPGPLPDRAAVPRDGVQPRRRAPRNTPAQVWKTQKLVPNVFGLVVSSFVASRTSAVIKYAGV